MTEQTDAETEAAELAEQLSDEVLDLTSMRYYPSFTPSWKQVD